MNKCSKCAPLSIQLQCPLSGENNMVDVMRWNMEGPWIHGSHSRAVVQHSWQQQIGESALQGHMFSFLGRHKVYQDVFLTEDKLPPDVFWINGPAFGGIPSFYDSDGDSLALANICFGKMWLQEKHSEPGLHQMLQEISTTDQLSQLHKVKTLSLQHQTGAVDCHLLSQDK